jgi:hypothetical protein
MAIMNNVRGYLVGFAVGLIHLHPSQQLRGANTKAYLGYGGQAHG